MEHNNNNFNYKNKYGTLCFLAQCPQKRVSFLVIMCIRSFLQRARLSEDAARPEAPTRIWSMLDYVSKKS